MRLSILICTYNRSAVLKATLSSLMEQFVEPVEGVEVVVVDNASADDTKRVVEAFSSVVYCHEPQLGLSSARNRALNEARGEWILFLDDDVIPAKGWLEAYLRFIQNAPADCGFLGGRVTPHFEASPPQKLIDGIEYMQGVWGLCEVSDSSESSKVVEDLLPVGANFGGRREAFIQVGFDSRYGRKGLKLLSFEETLLMEALIRDGWIGYWVPGGEVAHRVPATRFTLDYVARFYEGLGRSHWAHRKGYSRWKLLLKVLKSAFRGSRSSSLEDTDLELHDFTRQYYYLGAFKEAYGWG